MREPILVINAVFETAPDRALSAGAHGQVEGIGTAAHLEVTNARGEKLADETITRDGQAGAIAAIHDWFLAHVGSEASFDGVGHRVVQGGTAFAEPTRIDAAVIARLQELVPLAPLHQPHAIAAIEALARVAPRVPQVACFDTMFHRHQPAVAQEFALPRALTEKGLRRYGFHGISYEYIASVLPEVAPECARGKIIVAHLGNGASMCGIAQGRSVATTMGFTALDGLPMGTRTGALDPGVILYLLSQEKMDTKAVEKLLYERSGLLGVSGISSDMRALLASSAPAAREAVDLFVYRIGRELGSLAAALGGLDALVFTAGIGEHAAEIRARVCQDAKWLGVALDPDANARGGPRITRVGAAVSAWVVPTDENLMIARHTRALIDRDTAALA
jgi:acetate kinase